MNSASRIALPRCCALLLVGTAGWFVQAGGVETMTLPTLAEHAGQVLVGTVQSSRSYWAENPRRIETELVFGELRFLKGRLPDSGLEFRLVVPGGRVADWELRVSCTPQFAVGERWLLFLLPTYKTFPVVGLHQGAFRISTGADGVARVYFANGMPVTGLDHAGIVQGAAAGAAQPVSCAAAPKTSGAPAASRLVAARGLSLRAAAAAPVAALTLEEFVARIQPVLDASRDHRLTHPAGRSTGSVPRAVPLRPRDARPRSPSAARGPSTGAGRAQP